VRVDWFRIVIRMLGVYFGVQEGVASTGCKTGGGSVGVRAHNRSENFAVERQRRWLVESDTSYGWRGGGGRGEELCGLSVLD
jgi:hypothetical protein